MNMKLLEISHHLPRFSIVLKNIVGPFDFEKHMRY